MSGNSRVEPIRVVGRYAMYREIASGGMAAVHFGRLTGPVGFARTVAIKRLHAQFAKDPEFVAMFLDEARLASRIRHPNVVQTVDIVPLEGELFLVMDFVHGESLARLAKATAALGTRIPHKIVSTVMASVLHGLHAAHEAKDTQGHHLGIVHRDVSPHNIMVGADGVARVLDFGVAYAAGRSQSTREGQIKGKLAYMSPEQLCGEAVDRLTDVYAASVVLWELVAGRRLFDADNQGQVLNRVLRSEIERPTVYAPHLSPALEEVILRGLSRDRHARFPTARDMAIALEQATGVATHAMVSGWVDSVAGETLARRAGELALIEESSTSEDELTPSHVASQILARPPAATSSSVSLQVSGVEVAVRASDRASSPSLAGGPVGAPRSKRLHVVMALVASCAVGVLVGGVMRAGESVETRALGDAPRLEEAEALPPPTVEIGELTTPRAPATGTAMAAIEAPIVGAAPSAKPSAARPTTPSGSAKAKGVVDCAQPFTLDPAGHKKYKLHCL